MKKCFGILFLILTVFAATTVFAQTKWDLATAYPPMNFHTENISQFAADVEKATSGKLKITVHSNATLFKANEIKRAVQTGQSQAGEIIISGYANESPLFGLDSIPFVADDYPEAKKLWAASQKAIETKLSSQGMMVLFSVPWQPQGIYSAKPLADASSLKGMKWRSYNPASARMAELFKAQPVTIQAAELSQALATGVVEAFISSSTTGVDTKVYEHLKYFYDVRAWLPKNMVLVNKKAFALLDKATQAAVLQAAATAEARGWKTSEDKNRLYLAELKKNGMSVTPPSAKFKADLALIGKTMLDEWLKTAGSDGKIVIDAYRK
jgi:TRAP-type C4-dicarboxylate transport system substrate-binding protein